MKDQGTSREIYVYDSKQVEEMLQILDGINVKGLKDCQKIVMLAASLGHPLRKEKEERNGSRKQHR